MIAENGARSISTFRAMPWYVIHWRARTPIAATLRPPTQTPVSPSMRFPCRPDTVCRALQRASDVTKQLSSRRQLLKVPAVDMMHMHSCKVQQHRVQHNGTRNLHEGGLA